MIDREREREAETQAEGEAGSLLGARCELYPRTPGSLPELKADAQPLSHPGIPENPLCFFGSMLVGGAGGWDGRALSALLALQSLGTSVSPPPPSMPLTTWYR